MNASQILAVIGATFELVGFSWVIADASAALSREYGEHGAFRRVWYWFRYWLGPPSQPVSLSGSGGADGIERRITETRRTALRRERRGARLFMLGVMLTLISALV